MIEQAIDFREESEALFNVLNELDDAGLQQKTLFKYWTVNDVITHLHYWNYAADLSLRSTDEFMEFMKKSGPAIAEGGLRAYETSQMNGLANRALLETWRDYYQEMSTRFEQSEPDKRLKWAGPDMSARMSITARLMETWAHGQEIYDLLGKECEQTDRIKNIAVIGVKTFGWTHVNRGLPVPKDAPYVKLIAPSGDIWEWNEPSETNCVEGNAVDFCKVVTQTRNIADTQLKVTGDVATFWMSVAQCFAGRPEDPPAPGARFMVGAK